VTHKSDYTPDEWALLTTTTEFIGLRMLSASRSGPIGKLRELAALSRCLTPRAIPDRFRQNELVRSLLEDIGTQDAVSFPPLSWSNVTDLAKAVVMARWQTLPYCQEVAALLADRTPWAEADDLKRWLLWLARSVAKASGDKWLGSGRRVSDEEAAMLRQIAESLQVSTIVTVPSARDADMVQDADGVYDRGSADGQER